MKKIIILVTTILSTFTVFAESACGNAIQKAAEEKQSLFIFFYKELNAKTLRLQEIFDHSMQQLEHKAQFIKVKSDDLSEKSIVDQFDLKRTPMPFVIVLAPNGAITGGFPSFTEEQLVNAISSEAAASCLKALQDRKLVVLCLQSSPVVHSGVEEFKADPRFTHATEIVTLNPSNVEEHKFLGQLGVDVHSLKTATLLISPPGEVIGTYEGAVCKDELVLALQKAASGCCGPSGCCPGGKCGPKR